MRHSSSSFSPQRQEGEKRCLNSELWHACAGPLVSLPAVGSRVVYFPQGHSEQVAASTNKEVDAHIPNYPNLSPQLICLLHNLTMHADLETDEVYAQMTLQPLSPQEQKDSFLPVELGSLSKQPTNYFCKTLTASDTSTHGGFSVPRRAAEKVFPPLDFSQQPPAQELIARDLHDNEWKFRHIFRGQPKRHLLTTGWSVFVSAKRLVAGDSVLFIWNEKNQLLLGIRRASRPQTVMPSSVLSSDSMHIGLLAAAAHAAATNSRFTIFYNPRASPSEFVIPLAKYAKAVYHTRVSVGMRFRMLFETEESSVRRYMGTITGISDLDPDRWSNSHWRSVKVGWDESTAGERQPRVSLWEIEPLTTFPVYPSPFPLRLKRPWPSGLPSLNVGKDDDLGLNSPLMWLRGDGGDRGIQSLNFQGMGTPWMQPRLDASLLGMQPEIYQAMAAAALQEMRTVDPSNPGLTSLLQFQQPQNVPNISDLMQRQRLLQSQPQHAFFQSLHGSPNQVQIQAQTEPQPQSQSQSQSQAQAQVQAQSQSQSQAQDQAQVQAQIQAQAQTRALTQTPPQLQAQAQIQAHAQAHAQARSFAQAQSQAQAHIQAQAQLQTQSQSQSQSPTYSQAQLQAQAQHPTQSQSQSQSPAYSQAQAQAQAQARSLAQAQSQAQIQAQTQLQTQSQSLSQSQSQSPAYSQTQARSLAQAQSQAQIQAQAQLQTQSQSQVQAQAQAQAYSQAQAQIQAQAQLQSQSLSQSQSPAYSQAQAQLLQQRLQLRHQYDEQQMQHQLQQQQQQLQQQHPQHQQQQQQQQLQQQQQQLQQQQHPQHQQQQQQQQQQQLQQQHPQHQQQQQQQHPQHQQHQFSDHQRIPNVVSALSQLSSAPQSPTTSLQTISSLRQQNFPESNGVAVSSSGVSPLHSLFGSFSQDETSHLLNLQRTNQLSSSTSWLPKQAAVESLVSSGVAQCDLPQVELPAPPRSVSQHSISLPPFPGRECSVDEEDSADAQNHFLFGVNIDSTSLLMQNGIPSLRVVGSDTDSSTSPFAASNFLSSAGADFTLNPGMTTPGCLDESGFLQSPDNVGQVNPPTRTFVKVHKSGSFGRSLDITRFSSYDELRSELACMFGLEGQLEDPLRSGWQLVFVDRENDILLLGDDPWQEFVNNVWCIKILSPQEVQQMGNPDLELLDSVPRLSGSSCDEYVNRQGSRNLSTGITSVGSVDY